MKAASCLQDVSWGCPTRAVGIFWFPEQRVVLSIVVLMGTQLEPNDKLNCLGEVLMLAQRRVWSYLSLVRGFKTRRTHPLVPSPHYRRVPSPSVKIPASSVHSLQPPPPALSKTFLPIHTTRGIQTTRSIAAKLYGYPKLMILTHRQQN
jgi:hypothetical protein